MSTKVSVIICSYNRGEYIKRALDSVLAQSFKDLEVIIIDDASSDDTETIVKSLVSFDSRIKYFCHDHNQGIAYSRNHGISLSSGEYVAMLDSDDYWCDITKLERQVKILEDNKNIGLVGTAIVCIDENNQTIKEDIYATDDRTIRARILSKNQFAQSSVLFRRTVFGQVGPYDESLLVGEDLNLWLAIGCSYQLANLSEVMTAYCVHSGGISKQKKKILAQTIDRTIEKYKKNYPHYLRAKLKSYLRLFLASF